MKGVIRKIVTSNGYGFVDREDGTSVFFHHSILASTGLLFRDLYEGQAVEVELDAPTDKGPRAKTLTLASSGAAGEQDADSATRTDVRPLLEAPTGGAGYPAEPPNAA